MNASQLLAWLQSPVFTLPPAPPPPPPEALAEPEATPPPGGQPPELPTLWNVVRAVAASIATTIGVLGLLALVGGALTWLRLSQVGLPTQTGLSVTPKADLVILGATGLVIYVGLAVLLVAALFAVDPKGVVTGATLVALGLLVAAGLFYILIFGSFEPLSKALLVLALLALAAACLRIGPATGRRFLPFGVAVFFAVLLFGALVTYRGESDNPKVQPVAVLRGNERLGLTGFFVAATDDKIYIARLGRDGRPGALYDLMRDDKTRMAVGRRIGCRSGRGAKVKCTDAAKAAVALRRQLLADRRKAKAASTTKAKNKKKRKPKPSS